MKSHTGADVVASMKEGLDTFGIKAEQLQASSHDGQYFHLSVPEALRNMYGHTEHFISTVDPLHKAGTTDVHMWKDCTFEWTVKLFGICKELYDN